jgi:F-box and leucine-rich repeat protein GRR1
VARLRVFLNEWKRRQAQQASEASTEEADDDTRSEEGSLLQMNVQGNHVPGQTPVVPTPAQTPAQGQGNWTFAGPAAGGGLSQSAPTAGMQNWWGGTYGLGLAGNGNGGGAGAQQVTGMMGAQSLEDVDEGDEAFGEGSEVMGD